MLAALNPGAILLGVVSGGLTASIVGLVIGSVLTLLGADWGADVGLIVGVLTGLAAGGWLAGRKAAHSERFHGAVTGLAMAFVVMFIARFGGSNARPGSILWLALLSIVVSGFTGWLAGVRKAE